MSLIPEEWEMVGHGKDDGCPVVYVARQTHDFKPRLTIFKLLKKDTVWYNMGQWIPSGRFRVHHWGGSDATRPLRLSDSRIDTKLKQIAEEVYA